MQNTTTAILDLARQRQGLIRTCEVEANGLPRRALLTLTHQGRMVRLSRGLYRLPDQPVSEYATWSEIACCYPQVVVCLLSALQFHGLTTQSPAEVWVAIPNKARMPRIAYPPLRVVRFSGPALTEGVEQYAIDGQTVRVTSIAKTVADCFKYRYKIGLDVALEALREAWQAKRLQMDELWRYAQICRVANVMRPYLESLT